jgi:hypothetical protein
VEGTITVDKAAGKLQATTINEGIRLTNVSGDVTAETTNGDILIENAQTTSLDASTVNGDLTFNGTMRDGGAYRLTTHGGDIRLGLGGAPNATVFVRTFQGDFTADFPIQLPEGQSAREGSKRFNFTIGSGSARIELQSFNGDIIVARKTIMSAEEVRRQRRGATPKAPQPPPPPKPKGEYAYNFDFDFPFDEMHAHDVPTPPPAPPAPDVENPPPPPYVDAPPAPPGPPAPHVDAPTPPPAPPAIHVDAPPRPRMAPRPPG